jgi:Uma2 family endonuclease
MRERILLSSTLETHYFYLICRKIAKDMETITLEEEIITENEIYLEESERIVIDFGDLLDFNNDEVLLKISAANPHLRFETNRNNQLIIIMATKLTTGNQNAKLNGELYIWNKEHQLGEIYDSSTGFRMPLTGSIKSPDIAFILHSRLEQLNEKDAEGFAKIAPDFVIELRSDSDMLKDLIDKMLEYIENGVRLGWLIDPKGEKVYIYRLSGVHSTQTFAEKLSGEDVLPKFELDIKQLFKKK